MPTVLASRVRRSARSTRSAAAAVLFLGLAAITAPAVTLAAALPSGSGGRAGVRASEGDVFRLRLESDCGGDAGCEFDLGKKAKVRTVTAVTCLLQLVDDAVGVVGTVKIGDGAGFDYFIPVASTARFASGQGATFVQFEDFEVPARQRLSIVLFASGTAEKAFCSVSGVLHSQRQGGAAAGPR